MPLIKPRTRGKQFVRLITRLEHENNEALYAYAQFLGEPVEYILNQLIDTVLAKDKEFVTWRANHQDSSVPRKQAPKRVRNRARSDSASNSDATAGPRLIPSSPTGSEG